jgi:hypothetical protein
MSREAFVESGFGFFAILLVDVAPRIASVGIFAIDFAVRAGVGRAAFGSWSAGF